MWREIGKQTRAIGIDLQSRVEESSGIRSTVPRVLKLISCSCWRTTCNLRHPLRDGYCANWLSWNLHEQSGQTEP